MSLACGCDASFAGMAACHCLKCHYRSPTDRPATPTIGWHGPVCTRPCWAWSHSAIAVGAGLPATPRNRLRWAWPSSLGSRPPHRTHAIGARSTIDEVRDRLRIMGGLPEDSPPDGSHRPGQPVDHPRQLDSLSRADPPPVPAGQRARRQIVGDHPAAPRCHSVEDDIHASLCARRCSSRGSRTTIPMRWLRSGRWSTLQ